MGASLKLPFRGSKDKQRVERDSCDDDISRRTASGSDKQYSVEEALAINKALRDAFADDLCQRQLKIAEAIYPCRGQRGHPDAAKFTVKLHEIMLQSLRTVLPKSPWRLEPGWEGYRQMIRRMAFVADDPRVVRSREEINSVLGLPHSAVLKPPAEEPVFVRTPDGSGGSDCPLSGPALTDDDGDVANEFWEETTTGELRRVDARPCADFSRGVQASAQSGVGASATTASDRDESGAAGQAAATGQAAYDAAAESGKRKSKHKHKR